MNAKVLFLGALTILLSAGVVQAQEEEGTNVEPSAESDDEDDFGHGMQFGLRAGVAFGYRMVFRYDKSPFCSEPDAAKALGDQQKFCGHAGPPAVDLGLSFAPLDFVEPFLWGRFGLSGEAETNTEPVIIVGAGARLYTMSDSRFKIFIEPAIGMELEKGAGTEWQAIVSGYNPEYKTDLVFHIAAGPQFDIAKFVGIYANAGLTTGILRSIHTSLELQGGVQLRVP